MSVMIYRNKLNREMRVFSKFSKRVVNNLFAKGKTVEIVYNEHKKECLDQMSQHDTLIFISHGASDAIFHKFNRKSDSEHQYLITRGNVDFLMGKKVIAISCGTARELGQVACDEGRCLSYLGFYNSIHFGKANNKTPSAKYHIFIGACYKDTFADVLEKAIDNNWSFGKLKLVLERELKTAVTRRATALQGKNPKYYDDHGIKYSVMAVTNVAENIRVFGDPSVKVG